MAHRKLWNIFDDKARSFVQGAQNLWTLKHWTSNANPLEQMLFRFDNPGSLKYWTKYCDSDIGGRSTSRLAWNPAGKMVFDGHLNLEIPKTGRMVRSGYASVMSPYEMIDIEGYDAIEVMAKGDGRIFVLNMSPEVYGMPWMMYQAALPTTTKWQKYTIPFKDFMLTVRGFAGENPAEAALTRISSVGFLMAERKSGPFSIEVDYMKLLNLTTSKHGRYTPARKIRKEWTKEVEADEELFKKPAERRADL